MLCGAIPWPLASARHPDRDHLRQLQTALDQGRRRPGRGLGTGNNIKIAYIPADASWLNRIWVQFTALRYFTIDGTDHASHRQQASMIRRYIIWRKQPRLRGTAAPDVQRGLIRH